jgi:hypothetical protein
MQEMGTGIKLACAALLKEAALRTGIGREPMFSVYNYMFNPEQLRFLMDSLMETADTEGCCVEAGCASGATTTLLRKWMECKNVRKQYYAIDTFSGFRSEHVEYEMQLRNKPEIIKHVFKANKKTWFDASMKLAGISDVISVEADVAQFDFLAVAPISFCLLDVDLYLPIAAALPRIYDGLSSGGMIVCDDCCPNTMYDGALQAYEEFVGNKELAHNVILGKFGIVRKPRN